MSRNYPNMSYCAFENTSRAMDQLIYMLEDAIAEGEPLDINKYEQAHYNTMFEQARTLMELVEAHQIMVEDLARDEAAAEAERREVDFIEDPNYVGSRHHY